MENTTPQSPNQNLPASQVNAQEKVFSPKYVLMGVVGLVVIAVVGMYLGVLYAGEKGSIPLTPTPVPPPDQVACTLDAKICPDGSSVGRIAPSCEFAACPGQEPQPTKVKRLYNPTDQWIITETYPKAVSSVPDSELAPISCSPQYILDANGTGYIFHLNEGAITDQLKDQAVLDQVNLVKAASKDPVEKFVLCQTDDFGTVAITENHPNGGDVGQNFIHIGTLKDGEYRAISTLRDKGVPQFTCDRPLQLTTDSSFYILCHGGGADGSSSGIYRSVLNVGDLEEVSFCSLYPQAEAPVCDKK